MHCCPACEMPANREKTAHGSISGAFPFMTGSLSGKSICVPFYARIMGVLIFYAKTASLLSTPLDGMGSVRLISSIKLHNQGTGCRG